MSGVMPFIGCCSLCQYVPKKCRPRSLINFVSAASKGLFLDFEVYEGRTALLSETHLAMGPYVLHLVYILPMNYC
jgi:hypothetical protein